MVSQTFLFLFIEVSPLPPKKGGKEEKKRRNKKKEKEEKLTSPGVALTSCPVA